MKNTIFIQFINHSMSSEALFTYKISGQNIIATHPISTLNEYQDNLSIPQSKSFEFSSHGISLSTIGNFFTIFEGKGIIANAPRDLIVKFDGERIFLKINKIAQFIISNQGSYIQVYEDKTTKSLIDQAILGPALILALAQKGIWCLHASSVSINNSLILFSGESGKGKSTLGQYFEQLGRNDIQLITDDVTPLKIEKGEVIALPRFPQPKLEYSLTSSYIKPEKINIKSIFFLNPDNERKTIHINQLTKQATTLKVIRHTISSRLFPANTLKQHFDFSVKVSNSIPTFNIFYQHKYEFLDLVSEKILNLNNY